MHCLARLLETEDFARADDTLSALLRQYAPCFEALSRDQDADGDSEEEEASETYSTARRNGRSRWNAGVSPGVGVDCLNLLGVLWSHRNRPPAASCFSSLPKK